MAFALGRLLAARHEKGWTQDQLAEASGVSVDTVRDHEQGRRSGARTRKKLADALGVTLTDRELFGE
jgi:transcriptional regulator with XRE-family HTH domain